MTDKLRKLIHEIEGQADHLERFVDGIEGVSAEAFADNDRLKDSLIFLLRGQVNLQRQLVLTCELMNLIRQGIEIPDG